MRASLYLLTLTLSCFLKNGYCGITFEAFKSNQDAVTLVLQHYDKEKSQLFLVDELLQKLEKEEGIKMGRSTLQKYVAKMKKDDDTKSLWQASDSNQSYTNDYTTAYGQEPYANPSHTNDYTTSYGQEPYANPSNTNDYTTSYGQEPYANPSNTNDYTTSYGQKPYSNQKAHTINYQTDEDAQNSYWDNTHHLDDRLKDPNHGNSGYNPLG